MAEPKRPAMPVYRKNVSLVADNEQIDILIG
jgi:hypothetical protein